MKNLSISTSVNMTRKFDNEIYSFRKACEENWTLAFEKLSQIAPKTGREEKYIYLLLEAVHMRFPYEPVHTRLIGMRRLEIIIGGAVWGDSPSDARELIISLVFAPGRKPCDNVEAYLFKGEEEVVSINHASFKEVLSLFEM